MRLKSEIRNPKSAIRNPQSAIHRSGFSLVEVMCAILILGVALVGLTQGITTALSSNKDSELQTTAALFAAGQIELLRADGDITDGETEGDCGDDLPLYQWKQSVRSTEINGLHEVSVVVENANSGKEIYELRTMLFDPPLDDAADKKAGDKSKAKSKRKGKGSQ